ncbi:MAG: LacI family transcriptional regulator [Spartobacteria bacterium]|nr:LacI family transcriptional regulator [Spartobacteria bacterium]
MTKGQGLTLRQIAELSGISKSTVSRVLTKHPGVSERTRDRVEQVMREHGFQPNLFARGLAGGPTGLVAVIATEITSGFFAEVMNGINEVASGQEGHLLSCIAHNTGDYINLWRTFARKGRVDGVVLLAPPLQILEQSHAENEIPVVLCACRGERNRKGWSHVDTVTVNNEKAMTDVLEHLRVNGARHILYVGGPRDVYDARERRTSFLRVAREHPEIKMEMIESGLTRDQSFEVLNNYLRKAERCPDGVIAFNDSTAYGIMESLKLHHLRVPEDVLVVGCDDEPASAILGLTTLHMPMRELGRESARLLFAQLADETGSHKPQHSLLELTLEIRSSSSRQPRTQAQ